MDFKKFDANFGMLDQLAEIDPKDVVIEKPKEGDVTVDLTVEALKTFKVSYKKGSRELGKVKVYSSSQYEDDKLLKNALTYSRIFEGQMVDSTIKNEIEKRTQVEFDKLKAESKTMELNYLKVQKNFI